MPQLNTSRRIWIYLPPGYEISLKYYPVIYMQDGQNIFDDATSFIGEWNIDGTVENLIATGHTEAIVVGIANGEGDRIDEYSPWINTTYGGGDGDAYADFILHDLKPYIDANYRTLPDRENTAIGGSSLGAFISYYMTLAYDSVFAKAFIFSPSFWFSDSVNMITENFDKTLHTKIYITAGEFESETIVDEINEIVNTLKDKGFSDDELISVIRSDGAHSEWFWKREYDDAYLWLFEDIVPSNVQENQLDFGFNYDMQNQIATISNSGKLNYRLVDLEGRVIKTGDVINNQIQFYNCETGIYLLILTDGQQNFITKIFIK
jgi:alpha-glucosidase